MYLPTTENFKLLLSEFKQALRKFLPRFLC